MNRGVVSIVSVFLFFFWAAVSFSADDMYPADAVWTKPGAHFSSVKLYDAKGRLITRLLPEGREMERIGRIPACLKDALVAVEDHRFYQHHGVDILGVGRALVKNIIKGRVVEGGSTITQQLVKNMLLSNERTVSRKLKEGVLALEFEQKYSKEQILEMYFNYVYFGNGAWGVQQAARIYFDKNVTDLSLPECAVLAGIPKAPNKYNPLGDKGAARKRRDLVLTKMVEYGFLSQTAASRAARTPLVAAALPRKSYFSEYIKQKLGGLFGNEVVRTGGYAVYTTLDLDLQRNAEQVVKDGLRRAVGGKSNAPDEPSLQGALLAIDPRNGDIKAVVGGRDFSSSPYNRAFYARRQPGSSFKPVIYAAALEKGIPVSSIWDDTPVSYEKGNGTLWQPENFDDKYYGRQSLREALAHSNNTITIKLLESIGIQSVEDVATRLGVTGPLASNLSLALGTSEVSLQELCYAYAAFANGGHVPSPSAILRIVDRSGRTVMESVPTVTQVLSRETAYLVTDMLRGVVDHGTGKNVRKYGFKEVCAGKTGTTDQCNDAWFVGYVPELVVGLWVGYDNPRSIGRTLTGGVVCAPMWSEFMEKAQRYVSYTPFIMPETLIMAEIDPTTGMLATGYCPEKRMELFIPGTEPATSCGDHSSPPSDPVPLVGQEPETEPSGPHVR